MYFKKKQGGEDLKEVKKRSAAPIYAVGAVWLVYCLLFPLYRPIHFLIPIVLAIAAYAAASRIFPDKTEYVEEPPRPEEPFTTGDERIDALLREGEAADGELQRLGEAIRDPGVKAKVARIRELTAAIFRDILEDRDDYSAIRRFADYFLPTTLKLLNAYDRMSAVDAEGQNISGTLQRIDQVLDTTIAAYEKQLDALFMNQALDIETDIQVLENMLKKEGLAGKDF